MRTVISSSVRKRSIDPLLPGLEGLVPDAAATLKQVLSWTGGQPFLTQKLCQLIQEQANRFNPKSKIQNHLSPLSNRALQSGSMNGCDRN